MQQRKTGLFYSGSQDKQESTLCLVSSKLKEAVTVFHPVSKNISELRINKKFINMALFHTYLTFFNIYW